MYGSSTSPAADEYAARPVRVSSRVAVFAALAVAVVACSNEPRQDEEEADRDRRSSSRDGGEKARAGDAGARSPGTDGAGGGGARTTFRGTFRGQTEVPDGGLPDGGTAWRGEGTVKLEVSDREVTGRLEAEGMNLEVRGNLGAPVLRAWLRTPAGQPRTEGILLGDVEAERIAGTWRTSGPGGEEVRAGTFEARR